MERAFTVLWTSDYCRQLKRAGDVGKALRVLFGGSHLSRPKFSSFGVRPGDWVYPIRVHQGSLFIVSRMRVRSYVGLPQYLTGVLGLDPAYGELHVWKLAERLAAEHPEWGHLLPWGCLVEVVLGEDGAEIRLDRAVPVEVVESLRFLGSRGERPIKHLQEGRIKSSVSLQGGVYRLADISAWHFARRVEADQDERAVL